MRPRLPVSASALALALAASPALVAAQDSSSPTAATTAPPTAPPPAPRPRVYDDIRYTDAHADHVILSSTAETQPAGTFFVSNYELVGVRAVGLGLGYAFTDGAQVEITGTPPFFKRQLFVLDVSLKLNVYRGRRWRTAFVGSLSAGFEQDGDSHAIVGGRLAAIETLCFTRDCGVSLSASLIAYPNDEMNEFLPVYGALGFSWRLSSLVSVLVEPSYLFVLGDGGIAGINGVLVAGGLRLSGRNFGVDLTLMRGFGSAFDGINDTLVLGLPFIAFTYRTDGRWADPPEAPVRARPH